MAIRRLSRMITMIGLGATQQARNTATADVDPLTATRSLQAPAFVQEAQITVANEDDTYEIIVNGFNQSASPVTDEPMQAGDTVWVSQTMDQTWVIHGIVKV